MNLNKKLIASLTLTSSLAVSPILASSETRAEKGLAMPSGGSIIKYFNPIHEKNYVNEKQDRIIKKKTFKTQELEGVAPIPNRDIGLFATLEPNKLQDTNYIEKLLAKPEVNGITAMMPWRVLEPDEDVYEWKTIDELLALCARHNKQLILRISTCGMDLPVAQTEKEKASKENAAQRSDTPDWVFDAGTKTMTYTGADGLTHLMPILWDGTYIAKWSNFVNDLGRRYDKNPHIQSIGITGGGMLGGTRAVPEFTGNKDAYGELEAELKEKHGMNPVQLAAHWKYVADIFPKAFPTQHLNLDIDPPTPNRKGQDCLDDFSDYLIYRYGERVYVTRQNVKNDKRGFDDYRVLLKFKNDTLAGNQYTANLASPTVKPVLAKVTKNALDDGIGFAEIPSEFFDSKDEEIKNWLNQMRLHIGYQIVLQEFTMPDSVQSGKLLPVHFGFINTGAASPKRPDRELDKDIPSSYKIQLEFKDAQGKTKALIRHTPDIATFNWLGLKPIIWEQDLKMPALKPGKYNIHLAIVDERTNHKLNYCLAQSGKTQQIGNDLLVGSIEITAN